MSRTLKIALALAITNLVTLVALWSDHLAQPDLTCSTPYLAVPGEVCRPPLVLAVQYGITICGCDPDPTTVEIEPEHLPGWSTPNEY